MKKCASCKKELAIESFAKNKSTGDGLQAYCRSCSSEKRRAYRAANPDRARQLDREAASRNRDARRKRCADWAAKNIDKKRADARAYYHANKERVLAYKAEYRKANYPKIAAHNAKRRARERDATPKWADITEISKFYDEARKTTELTGIVHHVDHVIPLKGDSVSGLHVQNNLRVIPAIENMKKRNSF